MANFQFKDKSVCATYFNIARDNLYRTFSDIELRVFGKGIQKEMDLDNNIRSLLQALIREKKFDLKAEENKMFLWECVEDMFDLYNEDKEKASGLDGIKEALFRKLLYRHFPFLGPVMAMITEKEVAKNYVTDEKNENIRTRKSGVDSDDQINHEASLIQCLAVLYIFALTLSDCRDYYTHHNPLNNQEGLRSVYKRQKLIAYYLKCIFTASKRINKENHHKTTAEVAFIDSKAYKPTEVEGKKIWVSDPAFFLGIVGESFVSNPENEVYQQKVYTNETGWIFQTSNDPKALSDFGIFYLCTFFISRKDTFRMIELAKLFENSPWNKQNVPIRLSQEELDDILKKKGFLKWQEAKKQQETIMDSPMENSVCDTPENNFIKEMLCIYRIRLPKGERMDMYDTPATVALDILNELNRCPNELYKLLSPDDQKDFQDEAKSKDGEEPGMTERKRYEDRFPYLALRAIDESKMLTTIRFQVGLGNYRFRFYDKECIDGRTELRRLQKSLNGFGRLSDMEYRRKEEWALSENAVMQEENKLQLKTYKSEIIEDGETELNLLKMVGDSKDSPAYITDTRAHYNIYNNRIGLYWERGDGDKDKDDAILKFPELKTDKNKEKPKAAIEQAAPKCLLSVRDLPALLFLCHLNQGNGDQVEGIIKDKYELLRSFFLELKENGKVNIGFDKEKQKIFWPKEEKNPKVLKSTEVPQKLLIYIGYLPQSKSKSLKFYATNQAIFRWEMAGKRQELLEKSFDMIGKKSNSYGKKNYERISHVQMATLIMRSIMDWLPMDAQARQKLSGLNYEKLRKFLSLFDGNGVYNQLVLISILANACLLESHPFLRDVVNSKPANIEQLYNRYFAAEEKSLDKLMGKDEEGYTFLKTQDYSLLPFVHSERDRWKANEGSIKKLLEEYLKEDHSLLLPDGIFTDAIWSILTKEPKLCGVIDVQAKQNVSYLISRYFEKVCEDNSQSFYFNKRNHPILTILSNVRIKKDGMATEKFEPQYLTYEEIQNEWLKNKEKRYSQRWAVYDTDKKRLEDSCRKKIQKDESTIHDRSILEGMIRKREKTLKRNLEELETKYKSDIDRENESSPLIKKFADIRKVEHLIRRYKTQDMILFLTAKDMLSKVVSEDQQTRNLKLENLFQKKEQRDQAEHVYFSLTGNYEFPYPIKIGEKGNQIKYLIKIRQENLSMKNYGKLRRLLSDTNPQGRLYTLLSMLAIAHHRKEDNPKFEMIVRYNDITADFAQFESLRPEVFIHLQSLEKEGHQILELTDPTKYKELEHCKEEFILSLGEKVQNMINEGKELKGNYERAQKYKEDEEKYKRILGEVAYKNMGKKKAETWDDMTLKEYEEVSKIDWTTNFRSLVSLIYDKSTEDVLAELRNSFAHGSYEGARRLDSQDLDVPHIAEAMSDRIKKEKGVII